MDMKSSMDKIIFSGGICLVKFRANEKLWLRFRVDIFGILMLNYNIGWSPTVMGLEYYGVMGE